MIEKKLTVINPEGLHMRPAAIFADAMGLFDCKIQIIFKNSTIDAKSLLSIMAACIKCGSDIIIRFDGSDEEQAAKKACELIQSGFTSVS